MTGTMVSWFADPIHGVDRVPQFNHLAFADDLSLYLNSEANANKLLEKVLQF